MLFRTLTTSIPRPRTIVGALLLLSFVLVAPISRAATVNVKLASLAPEGSIWDDAVKEMGAEWQDDTDGRVRLRVYAGGVAGDEPDVVRKMRIGQLHAAVLTVNGLADIDEAFLVFTIPLFFDSYEELYFVLDRLSPVLQERLEAKGYKLLHWGHAGWVHLFASRELRTLEDLKRAKMFVTAGDEEGLQLWKNNGYRPVPLATTDILTGLQTGMVDVIPSPPLAALLLQWYRQAPYMLDLGVAPLVGGTVISARSWQRIGVADQQALLAAASRTEERLETEVPEQDTAAIAEMKKRGLTVVTPQGEQVQVWEQAAEAFAAAVQDSRVPADILQQALAARREFRASPRGPGGQP